MSRSPRTVVHAVRSGTFAGVERYVCDVSGELAVRGWRVTVVGGDPTAMLRELPKGVQHISGPTTGAVLRALCSLGRVSLVHAHMTAAEMASVTSRPITGARLVATRHFAGPRGSRLPVQAVAGLLARGIDREIAISRFVGGRIGGDPTILLNGVPVSDGEPDQNSRTILVMQRLQEEKDTATAVRGFAVSKLASEGWRLQITGRGLLAERLRQLSEDLDVAFAVEFLGFLDDPASLRQAAAIFLAPAPAEPFGLSVVEAMAAGLPVVAADGGAHAEVLDGTGLLFPPGDTAACAAALRLLASSADERRRLGQEARRRQRKHLSITRHVDELEALYLEVLA